MTNINSRRISFYGFLIKYFNQKHFEKIFHTNLLKFTCKLLYFMVPFQSFLSHVSDFISS